LLGSAACAALCRAWGLFSRQAEAKFRLLFDHSSDGYILYSPARGLLDCNEVVVRMLRAGDKSQLLGLHPDAVSPEYQPDGHRSGEWIEENLRLVRERPTVRFDRVHRR